MFWEIQRAVSHSSSLVSGLWHSSPSMTMDSTTSKCKWHCPLVQMSQFIISSLSASHHSRVSWICIIFNLCFRALKKHGTGVCSLLKRLVFPFNKDSADPLSALLDFLRQIVSTEAMVSKCFYSRLIHGIYCHLNSVYKDCTWYWSNCKIIISNVFV